MKRTIMEASWIWKTVADVRRGVARVAANPWTRRVTLFAGMYAITATIIGVESGSLETGLSLAFLSAVLKTFWSLLHGTIFKK